MKYVIDGLGVIGAIAILYILFTLLKHVYSVISNKRRERMEHIAQSGTLHLDVLGRMDDLEASTKQHIREIERKVKAIQTDFDTVSDIDRDLQSLASIVNVQRGHIEALQAAVKLLSRRIERLQETIDNSDNFPEITDEEYAAL